MVKELNIRDFSTSEELLDEMVSAFEKTIRSIQNSSKSPRVLLSGGGTPVPLYKRLSNIPLPWDQITFGLVDDRFVSGESEYSNEKLIFETLLRGKARSAKLLGLVTDRVDLGYNLDQLDTTYSIFEERLDLVILGMGGDGHTASIFPNDAASEKALMEDSSPFHYTTSPIFPFQRITCSKRLICQASEIFLMITGKKKLDVLMGDEQLPIHSFLKTRPDIKIFWSE